MKKVFTKTWPYLTTMFAGVIFWFIGIAIEGKVQDLMINVAAAFFCSTAIIFGISNSKEIFRKKVE